MKYMSDYKNQAWGLKLEKSSVRTISLCPLLGDHLFHLVHLPVVLLVHLNDMTIITYPVPNSPTTYIVANMITAQTISIKKFPTKNYSTKYFLPTLSIPWKVSWYNFTLCKTTHWPSSNLLLSHKCSHSHRRGWDRMSSSAMNSTLILSRDKPYVWKCCCAGNVQFLIRPVMWWKYLQMKAGSRF